VILEFRSHDRLTRLDVTVDGTAALLTVDGEPLDLELLDYRRGEIDLRVAGKRCRTFVARRGDERLVFLDGRVFTFRLPVDVDEAAAENAAGGPNVVSQMPGTIVKVLVESGQTVGEGDRLLIIESMKMETELAAPVAGTVVGIHVTDGQTVGLGEPLLDIDPAEDDS
jgi:biotin carboxyl carrier protein